MKAEIVHRRPNESQWLSVKCCLPQAPTEHRLRALPAHHAYVDVAFLKASGHYRVTTI